MSLFRRPSNKDKAKERTNRNTIGGSALTDTTSALREMTNRENNNSANSKNVSTARQRTSLFRGLSRHPSSRQPNHRSSLLNFGNLTSSSTLPLVADIPFQVQAIHRPLRILIAPAAFGSLISAQDMADCIEQGLQCVLEPEGLVISKMPLYNLDRGLTQAFIDLKGATHSSVVVSGPSPGKRTQATFVTFGEGKEKTGVIDVSSAAGTHLLPMHAKDLTKTTSLGVGQVMHMAIESGCRKLIVDCDELGAFDGGAGMLQGLGFRFSTLEANGDKIGMALGITGETLANVAIMEDNRETGHRVFAPDDASKLRAPLSIVAACDLEALLVGPRGCATGCAHPIDKMERSFATYLKTASSCLHDGDTTRIQDIGTTSGSGASGGLGAGLLMAGATLKSHHAVMDEQLGITKVINEHWDLVIIAEKRMDARCVNGISGEVARRASERGAKVIALGGTVAGDLAEEAMAIVEVPPSLEEATEQDIRSMISSTAERAMRLYKAGQIHKDDM